GREFTGKMFLVCAGNTEYAGGGVMRLSPGARPDDGRLNVSVVEALSSAEALWYFPKLRTGVHLGHPKLRYLEGMTVSVTADPAAGVQVDGDRVGRTPASFEVKPGAIKVLTPG
ncbi:MAG: hypothetical protein KGS61_04835, partial [Verrucomicrobia bacterium]|nr:hypothetical protein [Verrucomicrobiota bacterium]